MIDNIKIKLTKEDIITNNVEMPEGYRITKYKTQKEIKDEMLLEADMLEDTIGNKPTDAELLKYAKLDHPYYQTLKEIERLREQLNT